MNGEEKKYKNANNNKGAAISVESCIKWGPTWVITTARNVWGVYKLHGKNVLRAVTHSDDNVRLLRCMKETENCEELQSDLDKM